MAGITNKVKFGLKNCHYAKATLDPDTNAVTFATPVAIPGAVNLSLDPEGDTEPFYADDMVYYTTVANNGYSGDLEIALIPDSFRKDILKETEDSKEVQTETLELTATPLPSGLVKVKTRASTDDAVYNDWYKSVYQTPTETTSADRQG